MSFRANLFEQENDKTHRHPFVNRLRTHTDGELAMNTASFSNFNLSSNEDSRSFRRYSNTHHRFGHHVSGEVMSPQQTTLPLALPTYNERGGHSPISRSMRKLRSSTWDAAGGGLPLSLTKPFEREDIEEGKSFSNEEDCDDDGAEDSFTTTSSLDGDSVDKDDVDVNAAVLDDASDKEIDGALSSLYQDEQEAAVKHNLETLEEESLTSTENITPRRPSLIRDKSSSSAEVPRRSVTFSNNVDINKDLDKISDSEKWNQSPSDSDSGIYNSETRSNSYYQQQHQQQQRKDSFLSHFNPFSDLSWSLVGSYIVRYAPCFICMKKLGVSATDRNVLMRLNLLCAFHAVVQIGLGLFLFVVTVLGVKQTNEYNKRYYAEGVSVLSNTTLETGELTVSPDLWNLMLFVWVLSAVSLVLLIASYFAQRAIRNVNLVRSVRFMWLLFWLLPVQIFFMMGLFDIYRVMDVYTKHWWNEPEMAWFRSKFCVENTAMTKCTVPIDGGEDFDNEEEWCKALYNSLDCRVIRDEAQTLFEGFSYSYYTANGVWALLLVALMYVTLSVLQGIISLPIVQRSKESNIPLWLTFPIAGCFLIGWILLYGPGTVTTSFKDLYMIGVAYLVTGGAFALAATMGISLKLYTVLNKRQKKCKQGLVVVFIVTIVVTIFSVTTIFATSIIYSLNIIEIPTYDYHKIACMLDEGAGSCTGCQSNNPKEVCPEWSEGDVVRVLKTILKQSGAVAAIFLVYALITLSFGMGAYLIFMLGTV